MNNLKLNLLFLVFIPAFFLMFSCQSGENHSKQGEPLSAEQLKKVPEWSKNAIWYQIFVERFRNGDTTNDPTPADLAGAYPDTIPPDWKITPWGQQWYKPDSWFVEVSSPNFWDRLQLRRYGGDLQGVLDELDYIQSLGITAIFFNPLNDAPSLHKYDPRCWRHIDRNFGPDPAADKTLIATEEPDNPSTWKFTSADSLFLKIVNECHLRGIKVILDYSWNHTGMDFWVLNDIRKHGKDSKFVDWYDIKSFDNPQTPEDELKYKGWYGIKYLPEIKKAIIGQDSVFPFQGNFYSQSVKKHIFSVAQRWLDPNGDGNPSDGIDGYRLDVAAEIPLGFWPEFRQAVRSVNPNAYLVGEVWWQKWPDQLMDPRPFLQGDKFDAIMNYRWYRPARQFFVGAPFPISPSAFKDSLIESLRDINPDNARAMMNLTSSHDSPRTSTSLYNRGKYKYHTKPYENPDYKIDKPDAETRRIQKMLLVHQYTFIGAPHIWNGDEMGMWGADDPDTRKPLIWPDITYEYETLHPSGLPRKTDKVEQDTALIGFYRQLITIRKSHPALMDGSLEFQVVDDAHQTLVYCRKNTNDKIWAAFNLSKQPQEITIPVTESGELKNELRPNEVYQVTNQAVKIKLEPQSAIILSQKIN